jgi:hypothetical protein
MMTEWRQERPPLTDEHLAEIRERTKQGSILTWPEIDRAVLLSEVDRLRAQVAAVEGRIDEAESRFESILDRLREPLND